MTLEIYSACVTLHPSDGPDLQWGYNSTN